MQTEKDRILELRKALEYHNYKYYIENAPEISDREFDGLMHDLEKLEEKYPEMYDPNSPTQRVGRDINQEFTQVAHKYPMLSLGNTYSEEELRLARSTPTIFGIISPPFSTYTVSCSCKSREEMISALCREALFTVVPAICTGSRLATGVTAPVRPT